MNKQDLIEITASSGSVSKAAAGEVIDAILAGITESFRSW